MEAIPGADVTSNSAHSLFIIQVLLLALPFPWTLRTDFGLYF